tara:strand:+ start:215 stop:658 length:444 start_codon:yes stop_codon:yes gene_type:complete
MLNLVQLIGNVGRDPEVRYSQSGNKIVTLSIATSDRWTDKNTGEKREKTEWHRIVCFSEGLCQVFEDWVRKGSQIYVSGALQTRKWTGNDGVEKYTTEVVLQGFNSTLKLLGKPGGGGHQEDDPGPSDPDPAQQGPLEEELSDEIPF